MLAIALAGCTFSPPVGSSDDDDDGTPSPGDRDGDGVGDAEDNCPDLANPPQRDHDGDARGDECDACPHLVGGDDDPDGDGIGVACDPEPDIKNPPPYWNGFYDAPDATWSIPEGMGSLADWEVTERDGKLGWRQTVLDGSQRHHLVLEGVRPEAHVMSAFVVDAVAPGDFTSDLRSATISFGYVKADTGDDFYFNCGVRSDTFWETSTLIASAFRNDTVRDDQTMPWAADVTNKLIVVDGGADRINGDAPKTGDTALACSADDSTSQQRVSNESTDYPDGQVGLRTYGMTTWFDYLFVVEPTEL